MAIQLGTGLRNQMMNQYESYGGTAMKVQIRTGAQPADCQATTSGTLLCTITAPTDWFTAASAGTCSKNGTWQGTAAAAGTAAHYRLYDSALGTCFEQGSVGQGSGDLSLDNNVIASGQTVTVTQWDRSMGQA